MTGDLGQELLAGWEADEETRVQLRVEELRGRLTDAAGLVRIPPPVPLVEGWFNMDTLGWLVGEPGHLKSFVAQDVAGCVAGGAPWHGAPTKQCTVMYVVLEGAPGLNARIRAWEEHNAMTHEGQFLVPRGRVHLVRDAEPLAQLAEELKAGLVIIDTQNRATVGLDENSNVDMGHMIAGMELIRERTHACVINVHHTAIGQTRPRGHSSIDGAADTIVRVAKDGGLVKIANPKQKDAGQQASLVLNVELHHGSLALVEPGTSGLARTDSEMKILRALRDIVATRGHATHADIKSSCTSNGAMAVSTFNWALRKVKERGLIVASKGTYTLADPTQGRLSEDPWSN